MMVAGANPELVAAVRNGLASVAQPDKAERMRAYMKSEMPYYGVGSPALDQLCRELFAEHALKGFRSWRATVLQLWRQATHREERYAAIALALDPRYRVHHTIRSLSLYEEMVVSGAWWDYVDTIATRALGCLLARHPRVMKPVLLAWSRSPNLWKRRAAIISQVKRKKETDLELLYACIEPNLAHRDFFIRKAIGWALRSYAWTDLEEVRRYLAAHGDRMSGLSRREALKRVSERAGGPAAYAIGEGRPAARATARSVAPPRTAAHENRPRRPAMPRRAGA